MGRDRLYLFLTSLIVFLNCSGKQPVLYYGDIGVPNETRYQQVSKDYMIVSQGEATSLAAQRIFDEGGNIVDAAVAASFTISVERPQSTGIGGGGFMMIHWAVENETMAVDFREKAPARAHEKLYQDKDGNVVKGMSTQGILASGVPGLVAGLLAVHDKYGQLPREQIMKPAIELAERGVRVYPHLAKAIEAKQELLKRYPPSKKLFLKEDGTLYHVGDLLIQKNLANTLRSIAAKGRNGFYKGWVANALVEQQQRLKGLITHKDLASYSVKFRNPVRGTYRDYVVFSMPPPSSGGVHVIQILNILENDNLRQFGPYSLQAIHRTASAMQLAFADRGRYLGDNDFVEVPVQGLTSKAYAKKLREKILPYSATPSTKVFAGDPLAYESGETSHFTIADRQGNVISTTQTINGWLGSGVVVPKAGFVMNNQMDDFSARPGVPNLYGVIGGKQNAIKAGKRPLSSMSPTIVLKNNQPVLALGSPAGSRIITCVTLTVLNYLEYKMSLDQAVNSLRYHHQWTPDQIRVEPPSFPTKMQRRLTELGYKLKNRGLGCKVQAIAFENGRLHGVSDPRGVGLAIGSNQLKKSAKDYAAPAVQQD